MIANFPEESSRWSRDIKRIPPRVEPNDIFKDKTEASVVVVGIVVGLIGLAFAIIGLF